MVLPRHVAIIMDGNGRWAEARGKPRVSGHKKGADAIRQVMEASEEVGISYLTLYAFSAENWQRSTEEVGGLMDLLRWYLKKELASLHKKGVCFRVIGDRSKLPEDISDNIAEAEQLTAKNATFYLTIALSYGARQESVFATKALLRDVVDGSVAIDDIDENLFGKYLYTATIPDPDLLIRTGGERRLSNFLLWQMAYTEFYFTDVLWPDFSGEHFLEAVREFGTRERRYGTA